MVAAKTQVVKKGEIKWNLPPMIQPIIYRAGQTLRIEITITNPQEAEEDYVLAMSLSDPGTGKILLINNTPQAWGLMIDIDKKTFTLSEAERTILKLAAKESLTITGDVTFGVTNCILNLFLLDYYTEDTQEKADIIMGLFALLREAPPFIDITRLMGPLITIAMLGMMIPMMEKALKPRE